MRTHSIIAVVVLLAAWGMTRPERAHAIFASPINAGCYIAATNQCRIHIEPPTVNVAAGKKVAVLHIRVNGVQIYDFAPDLSNPPPAVGTTFTPSSVALDFAALCGKTYAVGLEGSDTGDVGVFNLGLTKPFTCPDGKALKKASMAQ